MKFSEIPKLSEKTLNGLGKANYIEMTEIQQASISPILSGKDILATAKTGSGKTLAFLIPILEVLTRLNVTKADGPSALVISPTRELALQSYEVLRKIGHKHSSLSAGLVIGGKSLKEEKAFICKMNIIIATPGRLLQHMDQTEGFELNALKILVLDEADKILELGFSSTINAILAGLPSASERQTLLFSATLTTLVKDLARLSLNDPLSIQVTHQSKSNESEGNSIPEMPDKLQQFYMKVPFEKKIDLLYSFIKTHLKTKILVFVSSCKQVRFIYEIICKLHPGIPVTCLHGKQPQLKRTALFKDFCSRNASLMIATDIASRGLDFPLIDWVIHMDIPDSLETYIHRCGRTARYDASGNSLLFVSPIELDLFPFLTKLSGCEEIAPSSSKILSTEERISAICTQFQDIKYLAGCALLSYLRSLILLLKTTNKSTFAEKVSILLEELNVPKFSSSLGLADIPVTVKQFISTLKSKCNSSSIVHNTSFSFSDSITNDDDDDQLLVPRTSNTNCQPTVDVISCNVSRKSKKKTKINELGHFSESSNKRLTFDDEGESTTPYKFISENHIDTSSDAITGHISKRASQLKVADQRDRDVQREKKREKKRKIKSKNVKASESISVQLDNGSEDLEAMALSALGRFSK